MEQAAPDTLHISEIIGCARCGGRHEHVEARRMAHPFAPAEASGLAWTHWAPCPTNGDPILIMVMADAAPGVFTRGPLAETEARRG